MVFRGFLKATQRFLYFSLSILLLLCFIGFMFLFIKRNRRSEEKVSLNIFDFETNNGEFTMQVGDEIDLEDYDVISGRNTFKYDCIGNCVCEYDKEEVPNRILSKGVKATVSSITVETAVSLGEIYIEDKCLDIHPYSECPYHNLFAEVTNCDRKPLDPVELDSKKGMNTFMCSGNCFARFFDDDNKKNEKAENFGCEKMKLEGLVGIEVKGSDFEDRMIYANEQFKVMHLWFYCQDNSVDGDSGDSLCTIDTRTKCYPV